MILRILFFLGLLLFLPLWGIDRMSLRHHWKKPWRWALFLPNVALFAALAYVAAFESYTIEATYWKGLLLTWTLCIAIPEAEVALLMLPGFFFRRRPRVRRYIHGFAYAVGAVGLAITLYGFTLGYRQLVVKDFDYVSARLPQAFDGYRVVQFSDLHLGTFNGDTTVVRSIVDRINALDADLVVFTGDLVNTTGMELAPYTRLLGQIRARDGVMAVMGNHDYSHYYRWTTAADSLQDVKRFKEGVKSMSWRLLLNENEVVRRGADSIAVLGVENDGRPPFPALGDLDKAQEGLDDPCFRLLLSHDPSHWLRRVVPETRIDLTLSGHTHGMQFQIGSFSPAAWFYPQWGGAYRQDDGRTLYVSLGVGEALLPFRFGAWPEINQIVLRTADGCE